MLDASCRREDVVAAYEELNARYEERRTQLWGAYLDATRAMTRTEYLDCEHDCWSVLAAGLSGIDAEQRVMARAYDERIAQLNIGDGDTAEIAV